MLKTKAKEVVTFPFGLQVAGVPSSVPSGKGNIGGMVLFLEIAPFDANKFPLGPSGKARFSVTPPLPPP
jgi:hypothetical protein